MTYYTKEQVNSKTQVLASELIGKPISTLFIFEDKNLNKLQARIETEVITKIEFINQECHMTYSDGRFLNLGICEIPYVETDLSKIKEEVKEYNQQMYKI